jgi:hypothetical protein
MEEHLPGSWENLPEELRASMNDPTQVSLQEVQLYLATVIVALSAEVNALKVEIQALAREIRSQRLNTGR